MGLFKMFKKKDVEPSPPPLPEENIKAPVAFDNKENKGSSEENQFQDPFSSNQNMPSPPTQESHDSFNQNQNNFNEIPEPPKFEKSDEISPFPNSPNEPFNPDVPDIDAQKQNDFSNEIPSPFDQDNQTNENNHFQNKIPTFAEKFGTIPVDEESHQNQEIEQNFEKNQKTQESEQNIQLEENSQFEEKNQTTDQEDDHEEFSFSNENNKLLSESELPLEEISDKIETNFNEISKKINSNKNFQKEIHIKETKKEDVKEKIEMKTEDNKEFINSGGSYFLSAETTLSILNLVSDIESDINNLSKVKSKILDIEQKLDKHYSNWKKNNEEINSHIISMDKKLFR